MVDFQDVSSIGVELYYSFEWQVVSRSRYSFVIYFDILTGFSCLSLFCELVDVAFVLNLLRLCLCVL
jgi:hypothetical protein